MTPISTFFKERGGRFTAEDIVYLAELGLRYLIVDSVNAAATPQEQDASPPSQTQGVVAQQSEAETEPIVVNGIDPLDCIRYKIGNCHVVGVRTQLPDDAISGLAFIAEKFSRRTDVKVAILNPWVGEEVIAILNGFSEFRFGGAPGVTRTIYCIGEFEGDARAATREAVQEYGSRAVMDLFDINIASNYATNYVRKILNDPVQQIEGQAHQGIHLLVVPPSEFGVEFDAWVAHTRADAIVCGWGDRGILQGKLASIGVRIEQDSFWSCQASVIHEAIAKLRQPVTA
jgi:hypothetical protein